jgi:hypothetical protein
MANLFGRYQIQRTCDTFCQTFRFSTKAQELATEYFLLWDRIKLIFFASLLYSITILVVAFWVNSRMRVVKKTVLGEYCLTITFVVLFVIALINKSFITSTNFTFGNYWEILWGILAVVAFISVVVVNWLKRTQAKIMYFIVLYILLIVFLVSLLVLVWMTLYRIQNNYTSRRKYFTEAETKMCIKNVEWAKILIKFNKYMDLTFISESLWWFQMFYVIFTLLTIAFFGYCLAKIKKAKTFKYIQL